MQSLNQAIKKFLYVDSEEILKEYETIEQLRQEFVKQYPANQIINMQYDDYVVGKELESFCYWIETKLKKLGSMKGGSPADKKFGVYYSQKEGKYRTISKWNKDLNPDEAFKKVKNAIDGLLKAGLNNDIDSIVKNPLSPMFKQKILTTYYPDKYISVFSEEHVDYFLKKLGVSTSINMNVEEKRKLLADFKNNHELLKKFSNFLFIAFLYHWNNPKVKEVRLLPMSAKYEFPDMDCMEIQSDFFLDELINDNNGHYHYRKSGMHTPTGTLVLFQYNNQIIASAKLAGIVKHEEPIDDIYNGSYIFDTNSIRVFEPITVDELRKIDSSFKKFSQSKQRVDPVKYEEIMSLIQIKSQGFIPEEIPEKEIGKFSEGSKKEITVNAFERNSKARQECIRIHGSNCIVCGFDFGKVYGEQFEGKIHVHHIKPLTEIDEEYEVDPKEDLVPVCPNCHMILHSKAGGTYTVEEVIEFLNNRRN